MKERLIIIFVAIVAGLFITSAGFFIYQSTKKINDTPTTTQTVTVTPQQNKDESGLFITISEPKDESLTNKRTLSIKGSSNPENLIVISTNLEDIQIKPSRDGDFSATIDIDAGANEIRTRAIAPSGNSAEDIRTVTYSTEEF